MERIHEGKLEKLPEISVANHFLGYCCGHMDRPLDGQNNGEKVEEGLPRRTACALLVKLKLSRPVLFAQKRPGLQGKLFIVYKFRTMTGKWGEDGLLLSDEERLTPFGKALRAESLNGCVIIGQTTESLENKGARKVCLIHFHRDHDLFSYNTIAADLGAGLCRSA